jgi:hypothetical protein
VLKLGLSDIKVRVIACQTLLAIIKELGLGQQGKREALDRQQQENRKWEGRGS